MKRIAAFILALALLTGALAGAFAEALDYSYIEELSDIFALEVDDEGDAFIYIGYDDPAFQHKNSPDGYSSLIYTDILVLDYYGDAFPVWRVWVEYLATQPLDIRVISFQFEGKEYAFDMTDAVYTDDFDGYPLEQCVVILGADNIDFWYDLLLALDELETEEDFDQYTVTVSLYGPEDTVTFDLPVDALYFFYFMGDAMMNLGGLASLMELDGTPMEIVE
ncbi:MAG: hypothetical protein IJS53_00345 [Clostridia bacterium]|nr:hypothetical protein [Clostridia bacterium]